MKKKSSYKNSILSDSQMCPSLELLPSIIAILKRDNQFYFRDFGHAPSWKSYIRWNLTKNTIACLFFVHSFFFSEMTK